MTSTPAPGPRPVPPPTALTLTAREPADLIASAAIVLGFVPAESVVMLTFGARHPFHARIDLPDVDELTGTQAEPADLADLADTLLDPASRHGASSVALLVFTDDARLADLAWAALRSHARRRRLEVLAALRVDPRRWYPLTGVPPGADAAGTPYDLATHRFVAQAVLEGRVTLGSRAELAASVLADPAAQRQVGAVLPPPWSECGSGLERRDGELMEGEWARSSVEAATRAGGVLADVALARLLRALEITPMRDAVWTMLEREGARAQVGFWTDVVRRAPDEVAVAPALLLGWAAWLAGDGALAWCAVDRCLALDPDHPPAHTLGRMLAAAVPPSVWPSVLQEGRRGPDWTLDQTATG